MLDCKPETGYVWTKEMETAKILLIDIASVTAIDSFFQGSKSSDGVMLSRLPTPSSLAVGLGEKYSDSHYKIQLLRWVMWPCPPVGL